MKKIELRHDMYIPGWGELKKGERFNVLEYNKRFVYVAIGACRLRLARKGDCIVVY